MIMCDEHLLADSGQMSAEVNIQKIGLLGTLNYQQSVFEDEYFIWNKCYKVISNKKMMIL